MSVLITFDGPTAANGGSGSDPILDGGQFTDAAAAVAAVSNGFLVLNTPTDPTSNQVFKKRAVSASRIKEIATV